MYSSEKQQYRTVTKVPSDLIEAEGFPPNQDSHLASFFGLDSKKSLSEVEVIEELFGKCGDRLMTFCGNLSSTKEVSFEVSSSDISKSLNLEESPESQ